MGKLFIFVVAVGLVIGFALPSSHPKPPSTNTSNAGEITLTRGSTGHFYTDAKVNGRAELHFLVDTGATTVALTMDDARALGLDIDPAEFDVVGEGVGGEVRGKSVMLDSIEVEGKKVENVQAVVLEKSDLSLLGQTFLSRMDQVQMSGDYLTMK
jgi:aspartyl protease family protein